MLLPNSVGPLFESLKDVEDEKELYRILKKDPERLYHFATQALEDSSWAKNHLIFYEKFIKEATREFIQGKIGEGKGQIVLKAIQNYYHLFQLILPRPFILEINGHAFSFNPMVISLMSSYFKERIQKECFAEGLEVLFVKDVSREIMDYAFYFMESGDKATLWNWDREKLEQLLQYGEKIEVQSLVDAAETVLCRYIDRENLVETLLNALKTGKKILLEKCIVEFNALKAGCSLYQKGERLGLRFYDFNFRTLEMFTPFSKELYNIAVPGNLCLDAHFREVLKKIPKLMGLDLSDSIAWSPYFAEIPQSTQEVILDRSTWLNQETFKMLIMAVPQTKILSLAEIVELDFKAFGELRHLERLTTLNLSGCHQVDGPMLKMILTAVPWLETINLSKTAVSEQALRDIQREHPQLHVEQ